MNNDKKVRLLFFLGMAVLALIFLSAGLSEFELLPGRDFPFWIFGRLVRGGTARDLPLGEPGPSLGIWVTLGLFFFWILLTLWIITFILRPEARKHLLTRLISYSLWLLAIFLLLNRLRKMAPTGQEVEGAGLPFSDLAELLSGQDRPATPLFVTDPPPWLTIAITLTLIALLLSAAWYLWQRRPRPDRPGSVERLVQEAQQAIEEIRTGRDLKDTVMRCYQEMSLVLKEQRGLERQQDMTPREFESHLMTTGLGNEHIRRLTRLFESVRYGARSPGKQEEREAVACLTAIVEAYGKSS